MNNFTPRAQQVLALARVEADRFNHNYVGSEHLLLGLVKLGQGVAVNVLQEMDVDLETVRMEIEKQVGGGPDQKMVGNIPYTPRVKKVLALAGKEAKALNHSYVGTEHLLLGLLREEVEDGVAARVLKNLGVKIERTRNEIRHELDPNFVRPEAEQEPQTSVLRAFGADLTKAARQGRFDPIIGRDSEIRRVLQVFLRLTRNNPVLIGERGVGKTAIIHGLSLRIASGDMPISLLNKRIIALDLAAMITRAKSRSEFEDLLKTFLKEVATSKGNIILFIDQLHMIVGNASTESAMDASNIIKTALSCGELRCVGATTLNEYRKYIGNDAALARCFQTVQVEPPSVEETIQILKGLRPKYEWHHKVQLADGALEAAAKLSDRYLTGRVLPDKAIDIMDEAAAKARMDAETCPTEAKHIEQELAEIKRHKEAAITEAAGIPNGDFAKAASLRDNEIQAKQKLERILTEWREKREEQAVPVTEKEVAEVVSSWTGIPVASLS